MSNLERFERLIIKDFENEPTWTVNASFGIIEFVTWSRSQTNCLGTGIEAALSAFYDGLKEIHEYHKRHPYSRALEESDRELLLLKEEPRVEFSGEEGHGRYLDLHELYNSTLIWILKYREYLEHLLEYLISFFRRTEPLQDLDRLFSKVETDFEHLLEDGKKSKGLENGNGVPSQNSIDLVNYSTVHELVKEVEGSPEKAKELKEALAALGLKSGGTVQQLQLDKKHFVNGAASQETELKEIALKELKMKRLCEMLKETIQQTKENVQRKQALTVDEREKEINETRVEQVDSDSDDEEQKIYNPLKLPMGWDNKPIPYWLYRLHGLGQEFKCEICGDQSYWGRRVFERHFNEPLHQRGMRRLGIPNTKSFREVTSIQEAKALWEKIQARQKEKKWLPDLEEEYEDKEGNIYNKKVYNELRRQELII
ncbi:hypothetical protein MKW92_018425 [Papaver armeniacum]|nr:hypothetical protein MKW92_018425 [Papaver armeniacum]